MRRAPSDTIGQHRYGIQDTSARLVQRNISAPTTALIWFKAKVAAMSAVAAAMFASPRISPRSAGVRLGTSQCNEWILTYTPYITFDFLGQLSVLELSVAHAAVFISKGRLAHDQNWLHAPRNSDCMAHHTPWKYL
jgi:hypothetical protein